MTEDNETSDELEGEDLEYVLKLNAAMGWGAMMLMNKEKSIASFQASLDVRTLLSRFQSACVAYTHKMPLFFCKLAGSGFEGSERPRFAFSCLLRPVLFPQISSKN